MVIWTKDLNSIEDDHSHTLLSSWSAILLEGMLPWLQMIIGMECDILFIHKESEKLSA